MRKVALFLSVFLLSVSSYAITVTIASRMNDNGEVEVYNSSEKIEDRINIKNNTDFNISVVVKGVHKNKGEMIVASGLVLAQSDKYLSTIYEDDLDDFRYFIVTLEDRKIVGYLAETAWSDLYFTVNAVSEVTPKDSKNGNSEITPKKVSTAADADELLKWKKLLDSGAITQEEYNAKKKQLLGL